MVNVLDSGLDSQSLSPGWVQCVVFFLNHNIYPLVSLKSSFIIELNNTELYKNTGIFKNSQEKHREAQGFLHSSIKHCA